MRTHRHALIHATDQSATEENKTRAVRQGRYRRELAGNVQVHL